MFQEVKKLFNLLIVDDEEIICKGIKSMVKRMEYPSIQKIFTATELNEIRNKVLEIKPEIIITDINMPEINGLQMAEDILETNPDCRLIILSGYDEFSYARRAIKFGAVDYLLKPASMTELKSAIEKAVEQINYKKLMNSQKDVMEESLSLKDNNDLDERTIIGIAKKFVRENFNKDIDMAVVSNTVSMNYSYFSKLFKDVTGMNFSEYITSVRMEEARKMLDNPLSKIYEISKRVGYDNPKYFSKVFKAYFGLSPERYKNK